MRELGDPTRIVADYLSGDAVAGRPGFADLSDPKLREGVPKKTSKQVLFDWVRLVDDEGKPSDVFFEGDPLTIELGLESTIDSTPARGALLRRARSRAMLVFTLTSGLLDVDLQPGLRRADGHDPAEPAAQRPVHARPLPADGAAAGLSAQREDVRGGRLARARRRPAPRAGQPRARQRGAGVGRAAAGDAEPSLRSDSTRRTIRVHDDLRPELALPGPPSALDDPAPQRRRRGTRRRRAPRSPRPCSTEQRVLAVHDLRHRPRHVHVRDEAGAERPGVQDPRVPDDEVRVAVVAEEEDLRRLQLRVDVVDEAAVPTRADARARAPPARRSSRRRRDRPRSRRRAARSSAGRTSVASNQPPNVLPVAYWPPRFPAIRFRVGSISRALARRAPATCSGDRTPAGGPSACSSRRSARTRSRSTSNGARAARRRPRSGGTRAARAAASARLRSVFCGIAKSSGCLSRAAIE